MKLVGYIRVSKQDQKKSGLGLAAQRAMLHEFAAKNYPGVLLVIEEDDEAKSGALAIERRPGLARALARLEKGDVLIVARLDRLSRDRAVTVFIEQVVGERGCRIISTRGEGTEDDEPESILMRMIHEAFAVYERLKIRARTKEALGAKKTRGEPMGRPPYGWTYRRKKLVESPNEQATLSRIMTMYRDGMSSTQIAATLNADGVPSKRGKRWGLSAISRIIEGELRRRSAPDQKKGA